MQKSIFIAIALVFLCVLPLHAQEGALTEGDSVPPTGQEPPVATMSAPTLDDYPT